MSLRDDLRILRKDPLPFLLISMLGIAGFFGKSPWYIVGGAVLLTMLSFRLDEYQVIVVRAWRRHSVKSNAVVWGSIVGFSLMFSFVSFAGGVVVRQVFSFSW